MKYIEFFISRSFGII